MTQEKDHPAENTSADNANTSGAKPHHQPPTGDRARTPLRVDGFESRGSLLDRITALDADWFNNHPDTDEYWRDAYPVEIELIHQQDPEQHYGNLRMRVRKTSEWTHMKSAYQRGSQGLRRVGIGAAIYPNGNIQKLVQALHSEKDGA